MGIKKLHKLIFTQVLLCCSLLIFGQEVNYDESKIPPFKLPDPLVMNDGKAVTSQKDWVNKRRPEIREIFETQMYGKAPNKPKDMYFKVLTEDKQALNGTATRREVAVYFSKDNNQRMVILLYLPNQSRGAAPLFLGLNGSGNHTINSDPGITMTGENAVSSQRGAGAADWPLDLLIKRGYGLATFTCTDITPNGDDAFAKGVYSLFYDNGQTAPHSDQWGILAAWAWGMSRAMDYFETDKDIDAKHVAVMGTSRLGKAALWAGANDERFAMVVSTVSGCGGAALSKRRIGETVGTINTSFPRWFCTNFKQYSNHEDALPFDQHELIALIAPRLAYISSAEDDKWADPKGEFLSGVYAGPVYKLFGLTGIAATEMPPVDRPVLSGHIGYHIRTGKHGINRYDWEQYVDFADRHFRTKD